MMTPVIVFTLFLILTGTVRAVVQKEYENFCDMSKAVIRSRHLRSELFANAKFEIIDNNYHHRKNGKNGNKRSVRRRNVKNQGKESGEDWEWYSHAGFKKNFFSSSHGSMGYSAVNVSGIPVAYKRLPKCSNNFIRYEMWEVAERGMNRSEVSHILHIPVIINGKETIMDMDDKRFDTDCTRFPLFTVVREPLSHFNAGLREYVYRVARGVTFDVNSTRELLISILNANVPLEFSNDLYHISPYATKFRPESNHTILIGKQENFQEDMLEIGSRLKCEQLFKARLATRTQKEIHVHPTSSDPSGVGKAVDELLAHDKRFVRALCWLYLVDYSCFNYELPKECSDIDTEWYKHVTRVV